jgi:hypothetical protein
LQIWKGPDIYIGILPVFISDIKLKKEQNGKGYISDKGRLKKAQRGA